MWTPRRVALFLAGFAVFLTAYLGYSRALGWLDGLPQLPDKYAIESDGTFQVQKSAISPTVQRLIEAFGPDCPELSDQNYPTKLEFRNGESSVVLAAGATPIVTGTNRMTLAPFSLASFGKPRTRDPNEVVEISTFHADKAVLEFDRVINTPNDMNRAKLLRMELVSEPEHALPDPRRGTVYITNNQRSDDPNKFMVLRTPGPVFYRDPKNNPEGASGPDIWTDASVEIVDRQNLPRGFDAPAPATAPTRGSDLREASAVPAILAGQRLPPPTITAIGMRIFFAPPTVPADDKKKTSVMGGVKRLELRERVLINLWTDSQQGLISTPDSSAHKEKPGAEKRPGNPLATQQAPPALAGIGGGPFVAIQSIRALDRALLQIETLGPFAYDMEKHIGRFDVLPQANPNLPNDVQVTRVLPRGSKQQLFTQVLEIEFNGSPTGTPQSPAPAKPSEEGGTAFKSLHAWTYTPGRFLTISAEEDRLEAYGQDLLFEQAANRTTLSGAPLYAVKSNAPGADGSKGGGNVLTAGEKNRPARLIMEPGPAPDRTTTARVEGPGKFELLDPANKGNTIQASWLTSMSHVKEKVNGRVQDRLTFTDGAKFEDVQADYWLKGRELKLWLESPNQPGAPQDANSGSPLPQRLLATGDVSSHSGDVEVEQAEFLTVMFRDGAPPAQVAVAPATPMGPLTEPMGGVPMPVVEPKNPLANPVAEKPKEKPKPPLRLKARVIDTWVVRYPVPKSVAKEPTAKEPGEKPVVSTSLKYEMEKARCEGQVVVHQDPEDPEQPRGTDILGSTLLIDSSPRGSVLTVTGSDKEPGQVHHENLSILGPKVVIDQLHNLTTVDGRGSLSMPSGTDFAGTNLKKAEIMIVHWRDSMSFNGSTKTAEFIGKVAASQGESWVVCHTLQVFLDREVYFNQMTKPTRPPGTVAGNVKPKGLKGNEKESAKVEKVYCYPAPDDAVDEPRGSNTVTFNQVERDETGKIVKTQQLTARELAVFAQAQDDGRGDPYQKIVAQGPGTVRMWQPGQKDMTGPEAQPMGNAPAKPAEMEMKLTIVTFSGQMTTKDKGKVYQEATFRDNIQVISAPAASPSAVIERHKLPLRSVVLTCANQLVVSTHKRDKAPPLQRMDAMGNAFIRSDEYDGWGELITYDGQFVILEANGTSLARILSRFQNSENSGKRIIYDRSKNSYKVDGSDGGTFQSNPAGPGKR